MGVAVVGRLARGIVMMDEHAQAQSVAGRDPLQHLEVAIRVAESGYGADTDVLMNADRLSGLVVDEVEFRQPQQDGLAVDDLVFDLDLRADDLLWRDAVDLSDPGAHEFYAAAGDDVGLEVVIPQILEKLEHRLEHHLGVELAGLRVFRRRDPLGGDLLELLGRHAGMARHDEFGEALLAGLGEGFHVVLEHGLERLSILPVGVLGGERLDAVDREEELEVDRLLGPERAVVVENGDAPRRRHELRSALLGDLLDEIDNGGLGFAVLPGRQWFGGLARAAGNHNGQDQ